MKKVKIESVLRNTYCFLNSFRKLAIFKYTRQQAVFPLPWVEAQKFWPSVRRINDAFGDENLICSCAPISDFQD